MVNEVNAKYYGKIIQLFRGRKLEGGGRNFYTSAFRPDSYRIPISDVLYTTSVTA